MTTFRKKGEALAYFLAFIACIPAANWMIGNVGSAAGWQSPRSWRGRRCRAPSLRHS